MKYRYHVKPDPVGHYMDPDGDGWTEWKTMPGHALGIAVRALELCGIVVDVIGLGLLQLEHVNYDLMEVAP
jgi:hypothetical protein